MHRRVFTKECTLPCRCPARHLARAFGCGVRRRIPAGEGHGSTESVACCCAVTFCTGTARRRSWSRCVILHDHDRVPPARVMILNPSLGPDVATDTVDPRHPRRPCAAASRKRLPPARGAAPVRPRRHDLAGPAGGGGSGSIPIGRRAAQAGPLPPRADPSWLLGSDVTRFEN